MDLRIVVAEDDTRYRRGLETLFGVTPGFSLVGSFPTADAMLQAISEQPALARSWDIALVDIEMPGTNGIDAVRALKDWRSDVQVVMLTVFEAPSTILDAICAGADGYLLKKTPAAELLDHLRTLAGGGASLTPNVAKTVLELVREGANARPVAAPSRLDLTHREQEVLRALVDGGSYKQVAAALEISVDTVRTHIRSLYKKLQVQNVASAVRRAVREGLV